jgi:hypothetical protein
MPFHFAIDSVHGILHCQFSGELNDKSIMAYYARAGDLARNLNPQIGLLEFKDITSVDLSTAVLAFLADSAPAFADASKPRVMVAPTDLIYGKCRAFEIMGGGTRPRLQIVRTLEEAYSTLGVSNPQFNPLPETSVSHQDIDHRPVAARDESR